MREKIIKTKFSRIFKKNGSTPKYLESLNIIYETIKNSKTPLRTIEIQEITRININRIKRYIKEYLEKNDYIKKNRNYTPPYLMIQFWNDKPQFIYGKGKRDERVREELEYLEKQIRKVNLKREHKEKLNRVKNSNEYGSKFLFDYNELVSLLWKNNIKDVNKLKIGSGANKYIIS